MWVVEEVELAPLHLILTLSFIRRVGKTTRFRFLKDLHVHGDVTSFQSGYNFHRSLLVIELGFHFAWRCHITCMHVFYAISYK